MSRKGTILLREKSGIDAGRVLFALYLCFVLVCIGVLSPTIDFPFRSGVSLLNPVYLAIAFFVGLGILSLVKQVRPSEKVKVIACDRSFAAVVAAGAVLLLCTQALIVKYAWFNTGWDVRTLTDFGNMSAHVGYYSMYPNQLFLAGVFDRIARLGLAMGFDNGYLCVVVGSCLSVTISAVLAAFVGKKAFGYAVGYGAFCIAALFIGLSPWILVPYSDTYAMLWVVLVLWFFVCIEPAPVKVGGMVFSAFVGYAIKPTVIFILASIMCVAAVRLVGSCVKQRKLGCPFRMDGSKWARLAQCLLSAVIASVLAGAIVSASSIKVDADENKAFSMTHYLMMGFNEETCGVWTQEDVDESRSHATRSERQAANLRIWGQRVEEAGPLGLAKLFTKKTCLNYADGTMAWGVEGKFWKNTPHTESLIARIYGIGESGPAPFAPVAQIAWLCILLGTLFACILARRDASISVLCLSLLFLSVFLLLFECRARYLILYLPCFAILASLGWSTVSALLGKKNARPKASCRKNEAH